MCDPRLFVLYMTLIPFLPGGQYAQTTTVFTLFHFFYWLGMSMMKATSMAKGGGQKAGCS